MKWYEIVDILELDIEEEDEFQEYLEINSIDCSNISFNELKKHYEEFQLLNK